MYTNNNTVACFAKEIKFGALIFKSDVGELYNAFTPG